MKALFPSHAQPQSKVKQTGLRMLAFGAAFVAASSLVHWINTPSDPYSRWQVAPIAAAAASEAPNPYAAEAAQLGAAIERANGYDPSTHRPLHRHRHSRAR